MMTHSLRSTFKLSATLASIVIANSLPGAAVRDAVAAAPAAAIPSAVAASAHSLKPLTSKQIPAAVAALMKTMTTNNGLTAQVFLTPSGLYGIALDKENVAQIMYTDANARTITIGVMLEVPSKHNVGQSFLATHMPGKTDVMSMMQKAASAQSPEIAAALKEGGDRVATADEVAAAKSAAGFITGSGPTPTRIIYAFVDPLCGFCASAWSKLGARRDPAANGIHVKWIPTALGGDETLVAALLHADPAKRLSAANSMFALTARGTTPSADAPSPEALQAARDNMMMTQRLSVNATPTFFVQAADGSNVFVRREGFDTVAGLLAPGPQR